MIVPRPMLGFSQCIFYLAVAGSCACLRVIVCNFLQLFFGLSVEAYIKSYQPGVGIGCPLVEYYSHFPLGTSGR